MPFRLSLLSAWLARLRSTSSQPETSRVIIGSTGSGKSEGELVDLARLAEGREVSVVLLDGHGPLAFRAAGHWLDRGHERRLVYEPLRSTERVLCWTMLPQSAATSPSGRRIEDAETRDDVAQCFLAARNLQSLNDRAWTKDWLDAAIALCLAQPEPEPLASLLAAFRPGSVDYARMLKGCGDPEIAAKFVGMEHLKRKSEVQYERETGPARRLLELVCSSEVVRLRSRPGPFDWLEALRERRLIAFDGGGIRSREIKRTLFLLVSLQVIQAVRRHFAATQEPLPVVLVLEEAGALDLVSPFVLNALQELRKAGLAVHVITQSCLDFGDAALFERMLSNTPWQAWYQVLAPADQDLGARALANATFDPLAVHYTRPRVMPDGVRTVHTESHGESFDHNWNPLRHDIRRASTHVPVHRTVEDYHYKSPQLHEQEYRTKLATLRIGERLVRDRRGVRQERVALLRPPRLSDAAVRAMIDRLREQPIYQPPPQAPMETVTPPLGAAALLRQRERTR